jgi:histidinol-phosphate/aromatic aminotransferase/cobyric acid decarboxylase-like protein
VLAELRANQGLVKAASDKVPGLCMPVHPSNGNFVIIECNALGIRPDALVGAYGERDIMIRQGAYHTPTFGDRFVKVSLSVPRGWAEEFAELLPSMIERARSRNEQTKAF